MEPAIAKRALRMMAGLDNCVGVLFVSRECRQ